MRSYILAVLLLVSSPGFARNWQYEQVDTGGKWGFVELEIARDGTPFVCYGDADPFTRLARVAWKDSVWHLSSPGECGTDRGRHLALRPDGRPSVVLNHFPVRFAELRDSVWELESAPVLAITLLLTYDTLGEPGMLWTFLDTGTAVGTARRVAGTWIEDTLWYPPGEPYPPSLSGMAGFVTDGRNESGTLIGTSYWHAGYAYMWLTLKAGSPNDWRNVWVLGGSNCYVSPLSLAPFDTGGFVACYNGGGFGPRGFHCGDTTLDTSYASLGLVRVDRQNRPHVAYRTGSLLYAWESDCWHVETLPEAMDSPMLDFAVDNNCCPVIAFTRPEGVFLARGKPVETCEEPATTVASSDLRASIPTVATAPVRFRWPGSARSILIRNMLGQEVRRLRVRNESMWDGRDDCGRPVPTGLYFLVPESPGHGVRVSPARLVLIR